MKKILRNIQKMKIGKKQSTATSVERSLSENEYLRISFVNLVMNIHTFPT